MKPLQLTCLTSLLLATLQLSLPLEAAFRHTAPEIMRRVTSATAAPVVATTWRQHVPSHSMFCTPLRFVSHRASNSVSIGHPCIDAVFQYGFGRPHVAETFINSVLGLQGANKVTEVSFLPRDLPSHNPTDPIGYNFTVDVRGKTQDGRYFLVEMQNDFRDDYHIKALIEHSRMMARIDVDRHEEAKENSTESRRRSRRKYWKGINGIYTIVFTNKAFGKNEGKMTYLDELIMEPGLVNPYEFI